MKVFVATLALGSRQRQGLVKVWAKWKAGSHISCSQECGRVKEWTHTFPNELPLWELDFQIFRE
jgi:hypothetical protein